MRLSWGLLQLSLISKILEGTITIHVYGLASAAQGSKVTCLEVVNGKTDYKANHRLDRNLHLDSFVSNTCVSCLCSTVTFPNPDFLLQMSLDSYIPHGC